MVEFGEQLRRARETKGLTQQSLAEQLFVTRQTVSRWECGTTLPDVLMLPEIARLYAVTILPLFGGTAATLKLYKAINFYNNPIALVTSIGLYGGYFFYMYSFYKSLKWEYAEAALVDGAGHYRVFFRIMLPMVIPSSVALHWIGATIR